MMKDKWGKREGKGKEGRERKKAREKQMKGKEYEDDKEWRKGGNRSQRKEMERK